MNRRLLLILLLVLALGGAAVAVATSAGRRGPEQPVAFSHKVHVGDRGISCTYCHQGVATTANALLPSTETCMDCHRVVKPDSPDIKKVAAAFQAGEAIEWVRVTDLPDFVRFTHRRHIQAGVDCMSCHGDVSRMDRVYKANSLTMGTCLSCHNQMGASTDCLTCHQ
jgi:hypothetical protein